MGDRYHHTQQFRDHYDWFGDENQETILSGNRVSSFFVYLVGNCTGGTTVFPYVKRPERDEFCGALKCKDENGENVERLEFEPKTGSAIFWYNLVPSGEVDTFTMHAGAPVGEGTKIGMNIWTRERVFRNRQV
jgi:prolyl 4-hydroxylase